MNKKVSIFFKYFAICSAVILVSFVCLGAVLLLVSSRYFVTNEKNLLEKQTRTLASYARDRMSDDPASWKEDISAEFERYATDTNVDFMLCADDGDVIVCSTHHVFKLPETIPAKELKDFKEGYTYKKSNLGGSLRKNSHIIGTRFKANGPYYYLLSLTDEDEQNEYLWNIGELFIISAIMVLVIVMFLVYFMTIKLTAPVKEIANASVEIGKGDFSVTLPEYSVAEFDQLANSFNEMTANLKSYDTMRNSFLANVSHELRTPMTSIGGFVDGMLDGTIPPEEQQRYLRIISSEVNRLARLVRSMLNLAKIEAGELEPNLAYFSVLEPIVDTLVTFENRLEEKKIEIRGLDTERMDLYADNDLVHQVMYNLIENAIKFVDEGGYIEFSFEKQGAMTAVSIKNSGEGLSEDELPLVFDRFYKTDKSRGLDKAGVGLGLNIVRSIVRLHGGEIMVRSVKGEYTEFVFTLPNKPADNN
ncbi:MAG: HAMP domain-containing histidine kinase [Ruminococcus sp.]|nr:HAMP domain-containing histidine kinase [Ruminococcus sp.]MBQ7070623.1 HAMP domain-containing histidine kinase [Ruminococcus sp.]